MALLTADELQRIEQGIDEAERACAVEVVVAVVGRSDRYDAPRGLFAVSASLAAALLLHAAWPACSASMLLLLQVPGWLGLWALAGHPRMLRRLIDRRHTQGVVHARAQQLFAERGIHRTRARSGLLILISELERRVVLLGDEAIDAQVGAVQWRRLVQLLTCGIRRRDTCAAVLEVLQQLRALAPAHAAGHPTGGNELPNRVVVRR